MAGTFANVDDLRRGRNFRKNFAGDQGIVEDDLRGLQQAQRLAGQKFRIAGAGADKVDRAGLRCAIGGGRSCEGDVLIDRLGFAFGDGAVASQGLFAGQGVQDSFRAFRVWGFGAQDGARCAQFFQPFGVVFAVGFFQFHTDTLGQGGAFAVGGDGQLQIAALDDGAIVEMAVFDVIDSVAEDAARLTGLKHGLI